VLPWATVMQGSAGEIPEAPGVLVQHHVAAFSDRWVVGEGPVPEAAWHDGALELLKAILLHWVASSGNDAAVFRNLAVRPYRERRQVGFDPDIAVVMPAPPGAHELSSLRLWEPGHVVPSLVVEVVSPGHPYKDYTETPDQCAALGVQELVVFDPARAGPRRMGRVPLLHVWQRTAGGVFTLVGAGDGPMESAVLGAHVVPQEADRRLRVSADPRGERLWPTGEEAALAREESALARIRELEELLARKR
jgi:Uma2 family endonuclease